MPHITVTGRPSGRFYPIDASDDEYLLNGFACDGEIRAFTIWCPACGLAHEIRARDRRPPDFDRQKQLLRCRRCRLVARVRITIDCAYQPDEPEPGTAQ